MFKRSVQSIDSLLNQFLRKEGLETPLLEKRLLDAWETAAGRLAARYTAEKYIKNQTLFVRVLNPSLKQDLSMMRSQLVLRLNAVVGATVITDIKIY